MRKHRRQWADRFFTGFSCLSVFFLASALVIILGPMLLRGSTAVFFRGTVEFRKKQLALFGHGNERAVAAEAAEVEKIRQPVFKTLLQFEAGIDPAPLVDRTRRINREYGQELLEKNLPPDELADLRSKARDLRDLFIEALESTDYAFVEETLAQVLKYGEDPQFKQTRLAKLFEMAGQYRDVVQAIDLAHRDKYLKPLLEVKEELRKLLGPLPGEPPPALYLNQYGATRWDMAQKSLQTLLWEEQWIEVEPSRPLEKKFARRAEGQFAGTTLAPWFEQVEMELPDMLRPRPTVYWRYFFDDWKSSHFFGGVGPEILGTLAVTVMAMLFSVPFGIVSAGYLVECAADNIPVRVIRTCINTLAGVPSIVFGLFGLAFFILYLFPLFGFPSKGCILAASMTLAVLVLPVIIRASEEAIRAVPHTYKEASLALGAGRFRTFIQVTLPAALPGILTGIILSLSRAAGETAPIMFTGAVAMGPVPRSLFEPTRTLSFGGYDVAVGDRLAMMVPHKQFGLIMTLILLILSLNILAIIFRSRMSRKLRGH